MIYKFLCGTATIGYPISMCGLSTSAVGKPRNKDNALCFRFDCKLGIYSDDSINHLCIHAMCRSYRFH